MEQNYPDNVDDVGFFALPAQDAANTQMTIWLPNALYIPKTTEGAKLEAAKKFVAFVNSTEGCDDPERSEHRCRPVRDQRVQAARRCARRWSRTCRRTSTTGKVSPALEFLSPIKGPNLENITVEVGSGITPAEEGAEQYDEDVKKQAQQLGLPGW